MEIWLNPQETVRSLFGWRAGETEAERSSDLTEGTQPEEDQSLPTVQSLDLQIPYQPPPTSGSAASCPDDLGMSC